MGLKLSITCLHKFTISVVHVQLVSQSLVLLQYTAWFSSKLIVTPLVLHTYTPHIQCFEFEDEIIRIIEIMRGR